MVKKRIIDLPLMKMWRMRRPRLLPLPLRLTPPSVLLLLLLALVASPGPAEGFYVPGVAPTDFQNGQEIEVRAIKMTSTHTQLPYDYYSLHFCPPEGKVEYKSQNLGEILRGDRIVNTAYKLHMAKDVKCALLCQAPQSPLQWDAKQSGEVYYRIQQEYFVHLIVDNLPVATQFQMPDTKEMQYEPGFRLGFVTKEDKVAINNHLKFIMSYHLLDDDPGDVIYRVVGFRVETASVDKDDYQFAEGDGACEIKKGHGIQVRGGERVRLASWGN